jgi:hypothetical protein
VVFSGHAVRRMFERSIGRDAVLTAIAEGETVVDYPDDKPYPSRLVLWVMDGWPIHAVIAKDARRGLCVVVTVYEPEADEWGPNFNLRRTR